MKDINNDLKEIQKQIDKVVKTIGLLKLLRK